MTNINMRLGGAGTLNDYNVNGYLFVDAFEIETVKGWLGSPEFLKSLSIFIMIIILLMVMLITAQTIMCRLRSH